MKIKIEMELPFSYCDGCHALSPRRDTFTYEHNPYYSVITCENAEICQRADKARREEEEHGREEK
jgi:RNase P subunit RPR2